ncbi:MAG: tetratricopeptide repeat protein [Oscillatoriales cyanobacterium SM2_1_8]|nr:tetratricopeptide repeat protein [Oscillatoriales cyanobacterium SM2_1_8]
MEPKEQEWLQSLHSENEAVREQATQSLWQQWFTQKGGWGLTALQQAQAAWDAGDRLGAELLLDKVIAEAPDFAEAWNRRAVLHYLSERYLLSLRDCERAVTLNPAHFGAWHGVGLCRMLLGNWPEAIVAFQKALAIQPYATVNQRLLLECTLHLT